MTPTSGRNDPQFETIGVETLFAGDRRDRPLPDPRSRRAAEHGLARTVENDLVAPRDDPSAFQRPRRVIDHQVIPQIGRASWRERGLQYVYFWVVGGYLKKQ